MSRQIHRFDRIDQFRHLLDWCREIGVAKKGYVGCGRQKAGFYGESFAAVLLIADDLGEA